MKYQIKIGNITSNDKCLFPTSSVTMEQCKQIFYQVMYHHYVEIDEYCGFEDFNIDDLFDTWSEMLKMKQYDSDIQKLYLDLIKMIDKHIEQTIVTRLFQMISLTKLFLNYPLLTEYTEDKILLLSKVYETTPTLNLNISDKIIKSETYYNEIIHNKKLGNTEYDRLLNEKLKLEDKYELCLVKH